MNLLFFTVLKKMHLLAYFPEKKLDRKPRSNFFNTYIHTNVNGKLPIHLCPFRFLSKCVSINRLVKLASYSVWCYLVTVGFKTLIFLVCLHIVHIFLANIFCFIAIKVINLSTVIEFYSFYFEDL